MSVRSLTLVLLSFNLGLVACGGGAQVEPEERCGDAILQAGEQCDDGDESNSDTEADACRSDCTAPVCGDGVVDTGEGCDDGDANSDTDPDACRTGCTAPVCGDGVVDTGEGCDDGDANSDTTADACRTDCTAPTCGDGVLDGTEACDQGAANSDSDPDICRTTCVLPACGDAVVDAGEACDDGAENSDTAPDACRTDCTAPVCGDGVVDAGESCDDGSANSDTEPGACRTTCALSTCGDGVIDEGEGCDDGAGNSDTAVDACRTTCTPARCGDGVIDGGETCDSGAENSDTAPDACRTTCLAPVCGDGVVDMGESCDEGAANSDTTPDACRTDCSTAVCGDGVVDAGESCDQGASNSDTAPNACRTTCVSSGCGDGVVDQGEVCDEGAANSDTAPNACRTDCSAAVCGDGVVDSGESCDAGAANSDTAPNACRTDCSSATCGDGVVDTGESCDEGASNSDTAPNACRTDCSEATCGDGVVDTGESCDQGASNSDTAPNACRTDCSEATCGDGVVDTGESCDAGASNSDTAPNACRTDCSSATCGDGVVDTGESCDQGASNSDTAPNACRTDCSPAVCGDGVVDSGESCDEGASNSDTAPNACRTDCSAAVCGDGVVDSGESCDDGGVVAGDGCSPVCAWEAPAVCDNSGHTIVNLHAAGTSDGGNGFTYGGNTLGAPDTLTTDCGGSGGEVLHAYSVSDTGDLVVAITGTISLNAVVAVETECSLQASSLACAPGGYSSSAGEDRLLVIEDVDPATGMLFVHVDSFANEEGIYDLHVYVAPYLGLGDTCAVDGHLGRCDPVGQTSTCTDPDGDGTGTCVPIVGLGTTCDVTEATNVCTSGTSCDPFSGVCELNCGNGFIDEDEECDDANVTPGDGCGGTCQLEGDSCADFYDLNANGYEAATGTWLWEGDTSSFEADYGATCSTSSMERDGVARFVTPSSGKYTFAVTTSYDAMVWVWDGACGDTAAVLGCTDALTTGGTEWVASDLVAGQVVYVVVDGEDLDGNEDGPFELRVSQPVCGNGAVEPSEQCDDGNAVAGDGCVACVLEGNDCSVPYDLNAYGHDAAAGTWSWQGDTSLYSADYSATCKATSGKADGVAVFTAPADGTYAIVLSSAYDSVLEVWDGVCGQTAPVLGCSQIEGADNQEQVDAVLTAGQTIYILADGDGTYVSSTDTGPFDLWIGQPVCGDGSLAPTEQCDDGNLDALDGCDGACLIEAIPEIEPNGSATTANAILVGDLYTGALVPAGDHDYYGFAAVAGTTYTFETFAGAYGACYAVSGSTDDTRIRLYDTDGTTELATDDDGGVGGVAGCSKLTWTAPVDGTYYLRVQYYLDSTSSSTIDPYFLELRSP